MSQSETLVTSQSSKLVLVSFITCKVFQPQEEAESQINVQVLLSSCFVFQAPVFVESIEVFVKIEAGIIERIYSMLNEDFSSKEDFTKSSLEIQRILLTVFAFYFNFSVNVLDWNRWFVDEELIELKRRQKASLNSSFLDKWIISSISTQINQNHLLCFYLTLNNSYWKQMWWLHIFWNLYFEDKLRLSELVDKRRKKFRCDEEEVKELIEFLENNEKAEEVIRKFDYDYKIWTKENWEFWFLKREN